MADPMHGIDEDVKWDFTVSAALISASRTAAQAVDEEQRSHGTWVTTAMTDFKGHYSRLFQANGETADRDATELASALRSVATGVTKLEADARAEQKRRDDARAWKKEHDSRSNLDKLGDFLSGGDDCPIPAPAEQLRWSAPTPRPGARHTPVPGSSGGADGTSSARPSDLHSFATSMNGAHDTLVPKKASFSTALASFPDSCQWGSLDASGVDGGFTAWLSANTQDAQWAKAVGDAFAAAGGEGAVSSLPNSSIDAALRAAGVSAVRRDLDITMPSAIGSPPTTGYANDPVNTATGNFVETESDLEFGESTAELWWRRTYNSVHDHRGPLGPGWSSWCEAGLRLDDEVAAFTMPDGRQVSFPRLGEGWDRASGEALWLGREHDDEGERLVVRDNAGGRWVHGTGGRLLLVSRGEGTGVRLTWDGDRLTGLAHERGRALTLEWDEGQEARIVAVHASDGRTVSYAYDDEGRLVAARGPLGTRRYGWLDTGLVGSVTDADGVVEVENTYDEHGRVLTQRSQFGRLTRFAYLPDRITVVSDEDGTRGNTWISDDRGRLVGVVDAHGERQSTAYDADGNAVMVTERDGTVTVRDHDDRGRLVREVVPDAGDTSYAWDDEDRLVRVEVVTGGEGDGLAVTSVGYEGDQREPSTVTDPEGGVTRMEWDGGLLRSLTDPAGVAVRFGYDRHGEVVSATDALGGVARIERDERGLVTAVVRPSGARTSYAYDPAGLLLTRTDPDGATWHFEHTTAGRRSAVVDPLGGRTEVEHDRTGERAVTIDPMGRATRSVRDDLGNLTTLTLPDGARWDFTHDLLGRLTDVRDPLGGVSTTQYDVAGDPSASLDPTGVRRELSAGVQDGARTLELVTGAGRTRVQLDKLGHLVSETSPDGAVQLVRYDRCGRPVESVDPVGGVTRVVHDVAGRVTTVVKPSGGEVGFTYDAAGQLETVTDESGGTVRLVRDPDGNVVERHLATGEVATTRYDDCGRVVAERIPGVGTLTCSYDAAGRMVERRDPRSGHRRFRYDLAGQMVAATDGNGGTTTYDYDANGRLTTLTSPDGAVLRREYDALDRLVAETDPLGRRTTAEYDAAGRQVAQNDPDGSRTEWRYDEAGFLASTWVDGEQRSSVERDVAARTVRITDRSGGGGAVCVHELRYDAAGRLTARTRDGVGPAWDYTGDGHRSATTMPDGSRVDYARDAAGRLVGVTHPLLGTSSVERDATGRVVSATAGGRTQRWTWTDGFLTGYSLDGLATTIGRDETGRVVSLDDGERTTSYDYDQASQLVSAVTRGAAGEEVVSWHYDAAGRLASESVDGVVRTLDHDLSGQLVTARVGDETACAYSYDPCGRRVREEHVGGPTRELEWRDGWLSAITVTDRLGDRHRTDVVVDALGELARVSGDGRSEEVFVDSADRWGPVLSLGGRQVVPATGFTGALGAGVDRWVPRGWREARTSGSDPWAVAGIGASAGGYLTPTGELVLDGAEWMGRRVYDAATRAFLSPDPLDPLAGAGWAGNPYSYAGNDPLHATDPLGLKPVTDEELRAYNSNNGIGGWAKQNWKGLALAAAGGVLMFVPGGQVIGMGLMSAGIDAVVQQTTTGHVNWTQVAISGVMGVATAGSGVVVARMGMTGAQALVREGAINVGVGAVGNGAHYLAGDGPKSFRGFMGATTSGAVTGVVGTGGAKLAERVTDGVANPSVLRSLSSHAVGVAGDGASGASGDVVNQAISTGHVDASHALKVGGASATGSAVIKGAQTQMPEPGVHTLPPGVHGPEPRPTMTNYHQGAGLLNAPVGAVTNAAFGAN